MLNLSDDCAMQVLAETDRLKAAVENHKERKLAADRPFPHYVDMGRHHENLGKQSYQAK